MIRGQVLVDLAVMLADGGEAIRDIAVDAAVDLYPDLGYTVVIVAYDDAVRPVQDRIREILTGT
jgi:hypothetical protein